MSTIHSTPLIISQVPIVDHHTVGIEVAQSHTEELKKNAAITINPTTRYVTSEDGFKIEHARDLQTQLSFAPSASQPQVVVIEQFQTATVPAQNALLKLLEEPPKYTQLILITTSLVPLLETITSRCKVELHVPNVNTQTTNTQSPFLTLIPTLLSLSLLEKLAVAEQLKDRDTASEFCLQAITHFHSKLGQNSESKTLTQTVQVFLTLRHRLSINCNPQLVVETALFSLPTL